MDIRQLEAFVYTVKYQSFSLAAQKLYISQPTVSAHIRSLEEEFHTQLLKRTTKSLSLTPAGTKLYSYATEILTLQQKAIVELANETKPQLRIGASSVPSLYFLPELLSAYHAVHPDIRVYASCSDSLDVVHKVDDGICDIGLVGTTTSDTSCEFLPFASDELVIAAPATPHYQAYQTMPSPLDALLKEPFLLREDNSGTKQETLYFLKNKGLSLDDLNVIAVMDDAAALKQCICWEWASPFSQKQLCRQTHGKENCFSFRLGKLPFSGNSIWCIHRLSIWRRKVGCFWSLRRGFISYSFCG